MLCKHLSTQPHLFSDLVGLRVINSNINDKTIGSNHYFYVSHENLLLKTNEGWKTSFALNVLGSSLFKAEFFAFVLEHFGKGLIN